MIARARRSNWPADGKRLNADKKTKILPSPGRCLAICVHRFSSAANSSGWRAGVRVVAATWQPLTGEAAAEDQDVVHPSLGSILGDMRWAWILTAIPALAASPTDPNRVYAMFGGLRQIRTSTDRGEHWQDATGRYETLHFLCLHHENAGNADFSIVIGEQHNSEQVLSQ